MDISLQLLMLFLIKHLFADFIQQPPYMYLNKGNLFHPGGYLHSAYHAICTMAIIYPFFENWEFIFALASFEFVAHYAIDYSKVNICKKYGWTATTSEYYWYMMGIDQFLHMICYIVIIQSILNQI